MNHTAGNPGNDEKLRKHLRNALPPIAGAALERDLWPRLLDRLEERPARAPWLDWALAALALLWLLVFPQAIPALLYQL